jgi:hypothetical protein
VLVPGEISERFDRSALAVFEASNGTLRNVQRSPAGKPEGQPVIRLQNGRQFQVSGCAAGPGTAGLLGVAGKNTAGIRLLGNDLKAGARPLRISKEVPSGAVKE